MSYPTSVTVVPTTTSPTTSASPITISTSSISSVSSSNAATSTTPAMSRTTPIATSMTPVATTLPTTITSKPPYGSTAVVTTEISATTSVAVPTPSPVNNSSNTGAIVGGAIGGVVVIIVLLGLFLFCLRRRRRRNESDGNLNPDHIVSHSSGGRTQPQIDLGEENESTPLPYPEHDRSMRQYGEPFLPAGAAPAGIHRTTSPLGSPSQYSDTATSPGEGYPSQGFVRPDLGQYPQGGPNTYAMQQADWHTTRPLTTPAPRVGNASASSSGRGMKERETAATAGRQGLVLPTQLEVDSEGSGAVQHQDAGQEGEPRDVPPAYESIGQ
ncbi:hypothetical protein DFJ58DRAFT_252218 [Suillus subalutaceus]|uniref:uncharacterized protein n=1 Tax=Suillus subalutaceus TaxID=48586 RepID=UPI001B87A57A|nr:uncharacterized protein DFJ58DRAFT_252218 [Suillus subalutaceus]KAG1831157.1 hypothetical protein DFJ58DRAFT_252218 [Suillus subalutaceus]